MLHALTPERAPRRLWWVAAPLGLTAIGAATLADPTGVLPLATALAAAGSMALVAAARLRAGAEELTRDSNEALEVLRSAVAVAGVGVWDWDLRSHRIQYSDTCSTMLGYEVGDVESSLSAWGKLVHPADLARVRAALDAHLDGRSELYAVEVRLRAADGTWRWILDRGRVVQRDADGDPLRAVGVHVDITPGRQSDGAANQSPARPVDPPDARGKILIVDDDPAMLVLMETMAHRAGFSTRSAPGAQAALALLGAHPDVDAIVTDFTMPDMTGVELARELERRGICVPVLLVSGSGPQDMGPVQAFLPKPFSMRQFTTRLCELVGVEPRAES